MPSPSPQQLGDYRIETALTPEQTFLAVGPGGRRVVLKMLDADCLLHGQLHPNIHARLSRVRELAHSGVANLLTVQRSGSQVFAVWEFIPGMTLDQYADRLSTPEELTALAREIIRAVQSLHALGLVHGRLHGANVIVDESGRVKLTHVSPLLYDDPAVDVNDLAAMLGGLARRHGWGDSDLIKSLGRTAGLKELRLRLSGQPDEFAGLPHVHPERRALRFRALLGALMAAVISLAAALLVVRWATADRRTNIQPPEAPSQAVEK